MYNSFNSGNANVKEAIKTTTGKIAKDNQLSEKFEVKTEVTDSKNTVSKQSTSGVAKATEAGQIFNSVKKPEVNMMGKIRKRSIKNNKIVYVNQSLGAIYNSMQKSGNLNSLPANSAKPANANKLDTHNSMNQTYTSKNQLSNVHQKYSDIMNSSFDNRSDFLPIKEEKYDLKGGEQEEQQMGFSGNESEDNSENNKKRRGSRYRGVSRNGNQWQVLIMVCKKKRYVGSYSNEEEAARAYDKAAIQNHGARAKSNFDYNDEELRYILSEPPILKLGLDKFTKH